jgi:hypothetical protein
MSTRQIAVASLLLLAVPLFAANVTIPNFQMVTRGASENGSFVLSTQADIDVEIGGGYKFGGQLGLSIATDNLEQPSVPGATYDQSVVQSALDRALTLSAAKVIVRDLFVDGLDIHYFVGEFDRLLTGDLFPEQFGTQIVATDFRGLLSFPDGVVYDGIHLVNGTGVALVATSIAPWLYLDGAVYQDETLGPGLYSTDLRAGFNAGPLKAETFLGASFPLATAGIYRGGLLLFYKTGEGGEVLTQFGVPRWAPVTDGPLTINDFFFLFEPRVDIGILSIILTLFWHPEYYNQVETNERGATDILVTLVGGDMESGTVTGGLESGVRLRPDDPSQTLSVSATPFLTLNASGVVWDFKVKFDLFPFVLDELVEGYVGIQTQF